MADKDVPPVGDLVSSRIAKMNEPKMRAFQGGISMAISSTSEESQAHVLQGLNFLHGGWDMEAYRHFAKAAQLDPDCLMANFGVAFSLLGAEEDFFKARDAAAIRCLSLVEKGKGTDLEQGYVYALAKAREEGMQAAADAFHKVSVKYPNDIQLKLFEAYLRRGGYDSWGDPTPSQVDAEKILIDLLKQYPDSPLLIHGLLMLRAEKRGVESEVAMAKKLVSLVPDYAPYQHLLGHFLWKAGYFSQSATAFSRAGELFISWVKESGATLLDCPLWMKSEMYRATALASEGDYETAISVATALANVKLPNKSVESDGARMIYWEAKTLPARIYLRRGSVGDYDLALKSLPKPEQVKELVNKTIVGASYNSISLICENMKAIEEKNVQRAGEIFTLLSVHGEKMAEKKDNARKLGELSHFFRAYELLEIVTAVIHGKLVEINPSSTKSAAYNWYSAAKDYQSRATMMMPPMSLRPANDYLIRYLIEQKRYKDAKEECENALKEWTNDLILLSDYQFTLNALGEKDKADKIKKKIETTLGNSR